MRCIHADGLLHVARYGGYGTVLCSAVLCMQEWCSGECDLPRGQRVSASAEAVTCLQCLVSLSRGET